MSIERIRGRWAGRTIACIASGPSLSIDDCELIGKIGIPTIAVNTSFRRALWADVLYAMDAAWWAEYGDEARRDFKGEFWSYVRVPGCFPTKGKLFPNGYGNSGSFAISLGIVSGASRIILTGYDSQRTNGQNHWHPDHPQKMGNAHSLERWPRHFQMISAYAESRGVKIINCTRETALTCFDRCDLIEELRKCASYQESMGHDLVS